MKPILEINNVGKKFFINKESTPYLSLRDSLFNALKPQKKHQDFWALKDVSFKVDEGDTIGIVGKNGAGKSTLLKILSKITPPTEGKIICRGRIASLLEVGTGFHPELSGRENVFMNGSILGMRKAEIQRNFDEIVDFSGVEKFIDTPLKHYSSGMQLRLAFAVAAFLENEILVIDEVLAVGDAEFQKKCIGKMEDVSKNGRTVLFVSHNIGAVSDLCKRGILLNKGRLSNDGIIQDVLASYLKNMTGSEEQYTREKNTDVAVSFEKVNLSGTNGTVQSEFFYTDPVQINFELFFRNVVDRVKIGVALLNKNKQKVFTHHVWVENIKQGSVKINCIIPDNILAPGNYSVDAALFNPGVIDYEYIKDICPFNIVDNGSEFYWDSNFGDVIIKCKWKFDK